DANTPLPRRTRVLTRARLQRIAGERRRCRDITRVAEERCAVRAPALRRAVGDRRGECDAGTELAPLIVACEERTGRLVVRDAHFPARRGGLAAEHELRIAEHGNGTGPVGIVADGDAHDAHGLVARHEHGGVTRETAVLVAETRVAETVTDLVPRGCGCRAGRQGVIRAGLVIADPERLAV